MVTNPKIMKPGRKYVKTDKLERHHTFLIQEWNAACNMFISFKSVNGCLDNI